MWVEELTTRMQILVPSRFGTLDHGGVEEGATGQNWPAEASLGSIPGSTESSRSHSRGSRSRFTPCSYVSPSPAGMTRNHPKAHSAGMWLAIATSTSSIGYPHPHSPNPMPTTNAAIGA